MLAILVSFLLGALAVLLLQRLFVSKPVVTQTVNSSTDESESEPDESEPSSAQHDDAPGIADDPLLAIESTKQGMVWITLKEEEEEGKQDKGEKVPKFGHNVIPEEGLHEQNIEVIPIMKYAEIRSHRLDLLDLDGSRSSIELLDCTVVAVSASVLSSHKWAKTYPIKLHNENAIVYNGSKTCYLYVESSWEKESWCGALRLASCADKEKLQSCAQLKEEFYDYLQSLSSEYPSLFKPSVVYDNVESKTSKVAASSLRVPQLIKRLAKKGLKNDFGSKIQRKNGDKLPAFRDLSSINGNVSSPQKEHSGTLRCQLQSASLSSPDLNNKAQLLVRDEGTLCWNLLLTRLFFDAKRSWEAKNVLKEYIQRIISNLRIPSFIGGVSCKSVDLEGHSPYIQNMRAVPMDFNEVCAIEADIEYSGGLSFEVEVRHGVYAPKLQEDNLEEFVDAMENSEGDKLEGLKNLHNSDSKWENLMQHTSEHVLEVPHSLLIRVASLQGTLLLRMKQSPSDHLWFGFTSMPKIDWNVEHGIRNESDGNSDIALLISNILKVAIRETLVFPYSECICFPWMTAEKDDWIPKEFVRYMGINREAMGTTGFDASNLEARKKLDGSEGCCIDEVETSTSLGDKVEAAESMMYEDAYKKLDDDTRNNASSNGFSFDRVEASPSSCCNGRIKEVEHKQHAQKPSWESSLESFTTQSRQPMQPLTERKRAPLKIVLKSDKKARLVNLGKKVGEKLEGKSRQLFRR